MLPVVVALTVLFFIFDRLLKIRARDAGEGIINSGIAFSIPLPSVITILLTAGIIIYLVTLLLKHAIKKQTLHVVALVTLLTGALSNLIDRLLYKGVIDYIQPGSFLPSFNIADILISVGIFLWLTLELKSNKRTAQD